MKFWCRHWYECGLAAALGALIVLIVLWGDMAVLSRVNLINFIGLLLHQYEEYGTPGGTPVFINKYMMKSDTPDRYPLNQKSAMITNCLIVYVCYLLPVLFPDILWLGIAPILFGCGFQVIQHLFLITIKFRHIYNPGLGAVMLIHVPCGIYFLWYVISNHLASGTDWLFGILYMIFMIGVLTVFLTYKVLGDKNSKYQFSPEECEKGERFAERMKLN